MGLEQVMTVREVYENLLRELNKVNAPSLHLEDYNYFINRGITEYINRRYNLYDTSQQTTDDLQVLTSSAHIDVESGVMSGSIGKAARNGSDANATVASGFLTLGSLGNDPQLENPVYYITNSDPATVITKIISLPDYRQFTVVSGYPPTGSVTFKHTHRQNASTSDMVLLGNADSVLVKSDSTYYGKTFKIENGVLIELPLSGHTDWIPYPPEVSTKNDFPQINFKLPENYYHMLNCVVNFTVLQQFKCYPVGSTQPFTARRLTADMYSGIMNNAFMKPDYRRPYFYVQNQEGKVTPEVEIRAGKFSPVFKMESIDMDYLRSPQKIILTTLQRDNLQDTSQIMEFPIYVCNEIIKITTALVMENASDPRLQTHIPVNLSVPQQAPGVASEK